MKILICEDNQLALRTLFYVLEKEGFAMDSAEDGIKALALMQKNVYDLILMDIHLPFHSGLELIKYLRSDLKLNTPVFILSAFSDPQMQRQAAELEISGYFVKPLKLTDLIAQIRATLQNTP
jgi:DNA-binding response OmpR family regulator